MSLQKWKEWFDEASLSVILLSAVYIFYLVAFAPPAKMSEAVAFYAVRHLNLELFGSEFRVSYAILIMVFCFSGSLITRSMLYWRNRNKV